ncbi:protein RRNAD1-like [Drosophila busckii]|uniref:protein RRNAD1-like n=1 Tax=Drosophila busckii TaxID=30019 RepID=UPI00083EF899|nr:protein RRNAD1-like [Drosophila busckii]
MSVPERFTNIDEYLSVAFDILRTYSWIYREPNVSCIKSIDRMPDDFKRFFLSLPNESLNKFPFVHESFTDCPPTILRFRQEISHLTPRQTLFQSLLPDRKHNKITRVETQNRKMGPKKLHEIEKFADHIYKHSPNTEMVIDLGSGLGYLSEALIKLNKKYLILGLEADGQRVKTARQRIKHLLPEESYDLISYEKLFITSDAHSRDFIERHTFELAKASGLRQSTAFSTALIGLHACADLSIDAMLLFLEMPNARSLHLMPCCYHKISVSNAQADFPFYNFPLSASFRNALSANAPQVYLNRPFMRLACQQTISRWRCEYALHVKHGTQMFLRGLAEYLCDTDELVMMKRKKNIFTPPASLGLDDVQQRFQLHSRHTGQQVPWRPFHNKRLIEISKRYTLEQGCCLAEALCCLQASIQQLCENLVLLDRLCYLNDVATSKHLRIEAWYEKLLDEELSPRCRVLVAKKL